jgi:hypothetical protein
MITRKRKINQIPSTSVLNTNSKILVIHEGSTATISALDIISGISVISADHLSDFNNPHQVTKTQVGLSNVENTADLDKPISTSTQIALDSKQDTLVSGVNIKTLNGVPLLGAGDVVVNFPVTTVNTKTGNVVLDSTDIPEGANLYYTLQRFDERLESKTTTNLAEGTNLYYTNDRFDTRLATKSTTDLTEGTNLYYTDARFDTRLTTKSTTNLAEGTNLYFTDTRVYTKVKASLIAGSNTSITFDDALQTITIASQGNVQSVNGETGEVVLDTDDISEGAVNFYYTEGKFDASLATKSTTDLTEGDNLYYTDTRFDDRLATKTTDDLTEGTNEYYTDAKVDAILVAEDVTKQGNTFNGAEQLVQLDADSKLPAVDGSNLTNLPIPPSTGGNLYLFYNY